MEDAMNSATTTLSAMLRRLMMVLAVAGFSAAALAGCNTVEGAGEDIESTGDAMQDSAD
jgi:predicted small secreted protein